MVEPVVAADGHTYEREAIEEWLRENNTSPKTREVLKNKDLTTNWDKISDVGDFLVEHPAFKGSPDLYLPKAWVGALVDDLKANHASEVMEWFSKDRRLLTQPLEGPYTAFHLAAEFGSPELLEMVCEQLEAQGALEEITRRGALIACEADAISSHSQTPEAFETPLKSSEGAGSSHGSPPEAIEGRKTAEPSLKNREIPAAKDPSSQAFKGRHLNTLLERALKQEDWLKAAQWLRLGAELEQPDLESGNSLLARCVCRGQLSAVQWLIEQGSSLSSCNFEGNTALHLSVFHDRLEVATFLLERKADSKMQNTQGQSAVHLAIVGQSTPMVAVFVGAEQGALSPYHIALLQNDQRLMTALLEQSALGIDAFDAQGHSPLWIASQRGDVELVRALLEKGAELELACGVEGHRALHIAANEGHQGVVSLLIAWKAEIEATDLKGNTALHCAAQAGLEAVSECLLEAGAYHKAKNREHQTPMELARQHYQLQVANFIEKKARALKQAKMEALRQITEEQAKRIVELEQRLGMLEKQEQKVTELDETLAKLLPQSVRTLVFSTASALLPMTKTKTACVVAEKELFLRFVAEGEQDRAEAILQKNPDLVLFSGNVKDLSGRTFENITGLQYAVWALDRHMWTMLRRYLPDEAAAEQLKCMGSWVSVYGLHAGLPGGPLDKLKIAYQAYSQDKSATTWQKQVGGAQLLLPAHVINEYCRLDRPFDPLPNSVLPRTRAIDEGEWFSAVYKGGKIGDSFAVYRGNNPVATSAQAVMTQAWMNGICNSNGYTVEIYDSREAVHGGGYQGGGLYSTVLYNVQVDERSILQLSQTRTQELDGLYTQLGLDQQVLTRQRLVA